MNTKQWWLVQKMICWDRFYESGGDPFITQNPEKYSSKEVWIPGETSYYKKTKIKIK